MRHNSIAPLSLFMPLYFCLRCLLDTDDEVRDRATFYVNILKEKEKALSSGYILNGWFIKVLTNQLNFKKKVPEKVEFLFQNLGKMTNVAITIIAACIFNLHI